VFEASHTRPAMRRMLLVACGVAITVNGALIVLWALGRIGPLAAGWPN